MTKDSVRQLGEVQWEEMVPKMLALLLKEMEVRYWEEDTGLEHPSIS